MKEFLICIWVLGALSGCTTQRDVKAAYERGFVAGEAQAQEDAERDMADVQDELGECQKDLQLAQSRSKQQRQRPVAYRPPTPDEYEAYERSSCQALAQSLTDWPKADRRLHLKMQGCLKYLQ